MQRLARSAQPYVFFSIDTINVNGRRVNQEMNDSAKPGRWYWDATYRLCGLLVSLERITAPGFSSGWRLSF